jgi:acyl carrier protein
MENGSKRMAAYFVPSSSGPTGEELRDFATSQLPQHMVPAFFVELSALPLSDNGKIDRAALSKLEIAPKQAAGPTSAPTSELERTLVQLWQRVLKVPSVGFDENFFDLGGDSLLLVAVHSNLQKTLQTQIPVTDLFEFPTIRKLAKHLGEAKSISPKLSDAQQRARRQREAFMRFRGRGSDGEL